MPTTRTPPPRPVSPAARRQRRAVAGRPIPFHVFVAYADVPAARRAISTITDVLRATGRKFEFLPMLWRFDQLAEAKWRECALADTAGANLIIFASSTPGELPPPVESWTNELIARKRGLPLTLVALLGPDDSWTISLETPPSAGHG